MTSFKTIAAAALLSALMASPVLAQAAISEPGAYSFYHSDRDVLNGGSPRSAATMPYSASQAYAATEGSFAVHHAQRHRSRHAYH